MKAKITFYIGVIVTILNCIQIVLLYDAIRFVGIAVGLFFIFWGLSYGWVRNRNVTVIVGHVAIVIGCLVTAYAFYKIPFLSKAPTLLEVLDLPLFWGIFTLWGGNCMITHGYCACTIKMHESNNKIKKPIDVKNVPFKESLKQ